MHVNVLLRAHRDHVAERGAQVAELVGITDAVSLHNLIVGCLLHDIGKVAIPERIITKPGPLDEDEWGIVKAHSILGEKILMELDLGTQAVWVRHHHERWDGTGYPDGLAGELIPLESRIIFVADTFDALTANRPYRRGCPPDQAMEEIRLGSGTQFDPQCVEALAAVYRDEPIGSRRHAGG